MSKSETELIKYIDHFVWPSKPAIANHMQKLLKEALSQAFEDGKQAVAANSEIKK